MGRLSETLKPRFTGCRFGELINEHADDEDLAVIDNNDVSTAAITEFVRGNWGAVGKTVVSEHRRKACSCYRTGEAA